MSESSLRPGEVGKVFLDFDDSHEGFHGDLTEYFIYEDLKDVAGREEIKRLISRAEELEIITRLSDNLLMWGPRFHLLREYKEAKGLMPEEHLRAIHDYTFDLNRRSRRWEQEYTKKCLDFCGERLTLIDANDAIMVLPLAESPFLVLHILPGVPLKNDNEKSYPYLSSLNPRSAQARPMNFSTLEVDGTMVGEDYQSYSYDVIGGSVFSYLIVFRNGNIEAVSASHFKGGQPRLHINFERDVVDLLMRLSPLLRGIGVEPPVAILLSLSSAKGYLIADDNGIVPGGSGITISRDTLINPPVRIEDFESLAGRNEIAKIMKASFDNVWRASGHAGGSPNFDEHGQWKWR